jgi:hypothetical protein
VLCIRDIEDPYYKVNPANLKALQEIADDMKGQDNYATAHPIYCVKERLLEIYGEEGRLEQYEEVRMVQPFFSEKAAKAYIEANKHNLTNPFVYVDTAYRNREWQAVRQVLLQLNGEAK